MTWRFLLRAPLALAGALALASLVVSPEAPLAAPETVPGEVIVRWKAHVGKSARADVRSEMRVRSLREFGFIDAEHLRIEGNTTVEDLIRKYANDDRISYIEPNYVITADVVPNDARFPELYGMRNTGQTGGTAGADIRATSAWDVFTGDPNLKIGVIDTGVDYNHPDLADNIWTNPGEIPGNNIDDDGNGYRDDVHGYDFVNNDGDPFDDNGHGTHCAGTIAGRGNNSIGVAGVAWSGRIIGIKFLSAGGSGSTAGAISSVQYAIAVGARLTSNSWGGGGFSQALLDAIVAAGNAGQLFVAAAGNSSANNDLTPHYPSSYNTPFVIAVAATDHNDNLASFSSYGATSVDIAAPGVSILSCQPGGGYRLLSGTSMATPHVAGAVALAMGRFPLASPLQIKQLILTAADVRPQLANRVLTNGRLNAFLAIADPDSIAPGAIADLVTENPSSNALGLRWTATGDDGATGRAAAYDIRWSPAPITDLASFLAANPAGGPTPQPAGSIETFEVGGLGFSTTYHVALRALDEFGNPGPVSNVATGTTLGIPNLAGAPASFSASLLTGASATQTLTLSNTGAGTLDFTVPAPVLQFSQAAPVEPAFFGKGGDDPRSGEPVGNGLGGPDGFGYRWIDSHEPGGPSFGWVDLTGVGTPLALTGDDALSAPVAMGISFPFYGTSYSSVRVSTNGYLTFTETGTTSLYENQPLPSSAGAPNMVAPLWDDLDFGASPRVTTHFDGSRFIVSWIAVPHYVGTGGGPAGPYTFQAILHPNGEIVYQYLSVAAPLNSATIGIQNGAKTVGLTTAFNTGYLADGLAVRFVPLTQWLRVTPAAGRILAGQSQDLAVAFDAAGLDGGTYLGTVRVLSNDPDGSPDDRPATLVVTGAPDIALSPAALDYGEVFVGATPTRILTVSNPGTDALHVMVASDDPAVTLDDGDFTVAPRAARNVVVTFAPTAPQALSATLTVTSNDPDTPLLTVTATGSAVPAPSFSVTPEQLAVALLTNTATTRTLRLQNSGGAHFTFTAEAQELNPTGTVVVQGDADNVDLPKDAPDVLTGPAPLRAGGPDVFGYTYQDSDEPGGPAFAWTDISAIGTAIAFNGDDQNLGAFPIGFSFPFYGNTFDTFRLCTNGWLSFTNSARTTFTNTTLPNTGTTVPENLLAVFWDDLDYRTTTAPNARAYYHNDGTRLIVQFHNVPRRGENATTAANTFQIVLQPNGTILYQYLAMNAVLKTSATIGIQNATRNDGLQVVFNAAYVRNDLAIRFRPPARFLTVTPEAGSIPPGGSLDLTVGFNAANLFGGHYDGQVRIRGNDPVLPQKDVPADLDVTGVPDVAASPGAIDFGIAYLGFPQLRQLTLRNQGTDVLAVSDITVDQAAFGVNQSTFTVPPLGQAVLFVAFNPSVVGAQSATLTVHSNDPDTPALAVALAGTGLVAPDADVTPASVTASIPIPGSDTRTLTLHNTGGSDLAVVIGTQVSATSVPVHEELELAKEEADPRPGLLGAGGPDVFGYTWRDSDEPGGPVFDWVDITAIGTPVTFASGDDSNAQGFPLGFAFPFYGTSFNTVNICTNGWLSFTSTSTAFTNAALPTGGTTSPNNLLAAFWDDLNPGTATPRVYRYSDGTRFIVSYVGVPRLTSGGPYTFQVILYPSGRIVYQYLSMQGTRLNEATVGIQNATRDDGLTVAFNAAYVHDHLAVEFRTVPEYLAVSPSSGTIPAGGSLDVTVTFDTEGLFGGSYDGSIQITSNDPDEPVIVVPTHLDAIGTPDLAANPPALGFGSVYVGLTADRTVTLRNTGSHPVTISGAAIDHPSFSLVGAAFPVTLGQNGAIPLTVRFTPAAACDCAATLSLASNDPDSPLAVALAGTGLVPPEIAATPDTVRAALATTLGPTALRVTKPLVIHNTGGSDLAWSVQPLSALPAAVATAESDETGKDHPGTPGEPAVLAHGGPDAFGYRWADSDSPYGAPFSWIDISAIGTGLDLPGNGDDQTVRGIDLPFAFPFYGTTYDSVNICSNGFVSFTSGAATLGNVALPNAATSTPENLIAAFWDDLDPDTVPNRIMYWGDATKFVISYLGVPRFSSGGPYTFQIILYPGGTVDVQYLDMQGTRLAEATVGIQNGSKTVGLTVVHNAAYVRNHLRVRFSSLPGWLTTDRTGGVTPAGGRDTVKVTFDATGLADGDHAGVLLVGSNDLDEPLTTVPAALHVGVVDVAFDFTPNTVGRSSGRWVKGKVWPPAGLAAAAIDPATVLLERTVPGSPAPLGDDDDGPCGEDDDGDDDDDGGGGPCPYAKYRFDRAAAVAVLPTGNAVPVEVIGRAGDVTWFRGVDVVRVLPPRVGDNDDDSVVMPEQVSAYAPVELRFVDPDGAPASSFDLWYSADAGDTWTPVALGIGAHTYLWRTPATPTPEAQLALVAWDAAGVMGVHFTDVFEVLNHATSVGGGGGPERLTLRHAGRNPGGAAALQLGLPQAGPVTVRVFDVRGAVVRELRRGGLEAGWHHVAWNGRDAAGRRALPGVYFIRAEWGGRTVTQRFALLK